MGKMNDELAHKAIDMIFEGESLKAALKEIGVSASTFYTFIDKYPLLQTKLARAQQAKAEKFVDEIIEISDTEPDVNRARLMSDNRKWYAGKMRPEKYGERIDVNHNVTVDISAALLEARARALPGQAQKQDAIEVEATKVSEPKQILSTSNTGCEPVGVPDGNARELTLDDLL